MAGFKKFLMEGKASYDWNAFRVPAEYLDDKRKVQYLKAIDLFQKGIEDKHIWNTDFKDKYSYDFGRNFETAFDKAKTGDGYYQREPSKFTDEERNQLWDVSHNIPSLKKSLKTIEPHKAKLPSLYRVLASMDGFQDMIKELKGYVEKGRKISDEKKEEKAKFEALITGSAASHIKKVLEQVIEGIRSQYEKVFHDQDVKLLNWAFKQEDAIKAKLAEKKIRTDNWWNYLNNQHAQMLVQDTIDFKTGKLQPNWNAIVEKGAKRDVAEILDGFVAKNVRKLAAIIEKKPNVKNIQIVENKIIQGNLDNTILFTFADGAKFTIHSQTIYKYTQTGRVYSQYPTRFKDVYLSNGQRMAAPDEEKMNQEFK